MTSDQRTQVLRTIDKLDRIGVDGVVDLLMKPESEFGANLMRWQAELIGRFIGARGASNEETLANVSAWFSEAKLVRSRFDMMAFLEEQVHPDGSTSWDRLLAMPANSDQTWDGEGRPENIAWALDDLCDVMKAAKQGQGDEPAGLHPKAATAARRPSGAPSGAPRA